MVMLKFLKNEKHIYNHHDNLNHLSFKLCVSVVKTVEKKSDPRLKYYIIKVTEKENSM